MALSELRRQSAEVADGAVQEGRPMADPGCPNRLAVLIENAAPKQPQGTERDALAHFTPSGQVESGEGDGLIAWCTADNSISSGRHRKRDRRRAIEDLFAQWVAQGLILGYDRNVRRRNGAAANRSNLQDQLRGRLGIRRGRN